MKKVLVKLKKYLPILLVIFLCIVSVYYFLGELGGNYIRTAYSLKMHQLEFNQLSNKFLNQKEIRNIQISVGFLNSWESVNNCSRYPKKSDTQWECTVGDYPKISEVYLKTIDEVLKYQNIQKEEYLFYVNFLKKYHFNGIDKDDSKRYVELSDKLSGLRYYEQENIEDFHADSNYLSVKKINSHWFTFGTDWN